jgi:hypothetical protein
MIINDTPPSQWKANEREIKWAMRRLSGVAEWQI